MKLDDLDRKFLPAAARFLRAVQGRLASFSLPEVRSVRDLDTRYGGRPPFSTVRDVPQLGFVVIAALILGGGLAARSQHADQDRQRAAQETSVEQTGSGPGDTVLDGDDVLGPLVGAITSSYEAASAKELAALLKDDPDGRRPALVSLSTYRTPQQLVQLLRTVDVRRAYLRAPAAGRNASLVTVDVKDALLGDLTKVYTATVVQKKTAAKEFQGYVDSIDPKDTSQADFRKAYTEFARASTIEAQQYAASCACVFAVVVEADARQLTALARVPGVRAVEVAGPGVDVGALQVHPLLPEVKGRVPAQQAAPPS